MIRGGTLANAARLLGTGSTADERERLGKAVMARFFDAVMELAASRRTTRAQTAARVEAVEGREGYERARRLGKGAVLVTAHLGSFETAVASLREHEPSVHVVFRRDRHPLFERLRSEQREKLGVIEAPLDGGLAVWFGLRDALLRDEVVLLQGDRVLPGQVGVRVAFFDGHIVAPLGPYKLARATGSPVIPCFAPTSAAGRTRIVLGEPFFVEAGEGSLSVGEAALRVTRLIESFVRRYPDQWLMFEPAWCEDQRETPAANE